MGKQHILPSQYPKLQTEAASMELDHIFILCEPHAKAADALLTLGLIEGYSRKHQGQGTTNRRFPIGSSFMLEFLWLHDEDEASHGPAKGLQLAARCNESTASPFGLVFRNSDTSEQEASFTGWHYQPHYFKEPTGFTIANNSNILLEPLCIYADFIQARTAEATTNNECNNDMFQQLSAIDLHIPSSNYSCELRDACVHADVKIINADQHFIHLHFDQHRHGKHLDLRPGLPLALSW